MSSRNVVHREIESALQHAHILPNSTVLIGLSGGVDSQVLTHGLASLDDDRRPRLRAVHVDHQLRPESGADARRVAQLCERLGIEVDIVSVDVAVWDEAYEQGIESAARAARYATMARIARDHGIRWLATGHNRDDQAETVLMRLISGASLEGLAGMIPISRRSVPLDPEGVETAVVSLLRPLLALPRDDIASYAEHFELLPIEDSSNESQVFRRNALRHSIIPRLEEIAPGAAGSIVRTASLLRNDVQFLADTVDEVLEQVAAFRDGIWMIEREGFRDAYPSVQRRVIIRIVEGVLSPMARVGHERVEALRVAAVSGRPGSQIEIGEGFTCYVDYGRVAIGSADTLEEDLRRLSWIPTLQPGLEVPLRGHVDLELGNGWRLRGDAPNNNDWTLRTRKAGDRVRASRTRAVRLQDWLVDRKVPRYVRDWLPLAVHDSEVRWIIGLDLTEFDLPAEDLHLRLERD